MSPYDADSSSHRDETMHASAVEEQTVLPKGKYSKEQLMRTISSMGPLSSCQSLVDLAEEDDDDDAGGDNAGSGGSVNGETKKKYNLVPVQEYYCSPTTTPFSEFKLSSSSSSMTNPTAATSSASSLSSSLSSTSMSLMRSASFSFSPFASKLETANHHHHHQEPSASRRHSAGPLHLLQGSTQQQQQQPHPMRIRMQLSPRTNAQHWEETYKPMLQNYLHDEQLQYFYTLYHEHDVTSVQLLQSLAYLASSPSFQEDCYWDRLYTLALHWSNNRKPRTLRLASLKTLMQCLSPPVASWQHCDPVIEGTLDFLLTPKMEWEYMDHTEMNLLLELRALCLCFKSQEQARIAKVVQTGDTAAVLISAGAKLLVGGMIQSGLLIEGQLDKACAKFKSWVKPGRYPLIVERNATVATAFTSAAKRASVEVQDSTKWIAQNVKDASCKGLEMVVEKVDESTKGSHRSMFQEQLSPESAEALKAIGKVGMATLGATAIVGEAMVETSRALMRKTGLVAADLVEHKYGSSAGKVVSDASETANNLVRAASNVTLLRRKVMAKNMAKSAGKEQLDEEIARAKDALHLLEIQVAGMLHQALEHGPAGGAIVHNKVLEGMKLLKQAQEQSQLVPAGSGTKLGQSQRMGTVNVATESQHEDMPILQRI